jgi:hypothetical protein
LYCIVLHHIISFHIILCFNILYNIDMNYIYNIYINTEVLSLSRCTQNMCVRIYIYDIHLGKVQFVDPDTCQSAESDLRRVWTYIWTHLWITWYDMISDALIYVTDTYNYTYIYVCNIYICVCNIHICIYM